MPIVRRLFVVQTEGTAGNQPGRRKIGLDSHDIQQGPGPYSLRLAASNDNQSGDRRGGSMTDDDEFSTAELRDSESVDEETHARRNAEQLRIARRVLEDEEGEETEDEQ